MERRAASDSPPVHVMAARRARRRDQMRGYRAKKALLKPPKPKHIVPAKNKVRNDQRKILRATDSLQKKKAKLQMRVSRARTEYRKWTTEVEQATARKNEDQLADAKARLATAEVGFAVAQVKRFRFNQKHDIVLKDIPPARFFELAQTVEDSSDDDHTDAEATPGTDVKTDSGELDLDEHVSVKNEPDSHDDVPYQSEHLSDDESIDAGPDNDIETDSGQLDLDEHVSVKNEPPKPQSPPVPPRQFPILKRQNLPRPLPEPKRAKKQPKKQSKIQKKQPMTVNPWSIAKRA